MSDLEPRLSDAGVKEFERLIEVFKKRIKEIAEDVLGGLYENLPDYIESDSWINFRNTAMGIVCDYQKLSPYDGRKIRDKIFMDNHAEIIKEIDKDHIRRIAELEDQIEYMRQLR